MRTKICTFFTHIGLFFGMILLLWGALILSALIPNDAIAEKFEQSALSYKVADAYQFPESGRLKAITDNYADSILLNVAWNMGNGSPTVASVDTDFYDGLYNGQDLGENAGLYLTVTEGIEPNTDYTRYWHGCAIFVRVLHLFTDVRGIRIIGAAAALLLTALCTVMLIRKKHADLALLMLLSMAAVQAWNIVLSLEYQPAFILSLLLCALYLQAEHKGDGALTRLSVIGGVLIAFFDFLTTETMTILLPLILVVAVREKEGRLAPFKESLFTLFKCGGCWLCAYAGTFLTKWTAASLITGENAFVSALSSVGERIGGEIPGGESAPNTIFSSIAANLTVLFGGRERVEAGRVVIGLILLLGLLGSVLYLFHAGKTRRDAAILLLLLGGVVLLRYLVLNNHSYLHEFFTYRALSSTIFALLSAVWLNIEFRRRKGRRQ